VRQDFGKFHKQLLDFPLLMRLVFAEKAGAHHPVILSQRQELEKR